MIRVELLGLTDLPLVRPGDDLAALIAAALDRQGLALAAHDLVVVAQKVVSKAEGRLVRLSSVTPSPTAERLAAQVEKDPRLVELILRESKSVLRVRPGLVIVEHRLGFVCANAGIDRSNIQQEGSDAHDETVALLPLDPDASAAALRRALEARDGVPLAVLIIDSHGRAFREGIVGVAIGCSGVAPVIDKRGDPDLLGYRLQVTEIGHADEIASAASLLMGQADEGVPVVVMRGLRYARGEEPARRIARLPARDLFRPPPMELG
ncbi:MAG: coenzyme F420-0:L-glutamate ligase [Chloroflexi bacterium]|nr:coenzyme F420-0:L-glutamate ligase [Chloroflexota bacterium]MBI4507491.1 coenzyme F420-0:L-glutamate ligase [Chloroflexota bacterium]